MHRQRSDLDERFQHEQAFVHTRVRHGQVAARFLNVQLLGAVKKQIEVERARPKPLAPDAPQLGFDRLQNPQQRRRVKRRAQDSRRVQIRPLPGRPADRFRFVIR